jgi:hypothetical protein
MFRYRELDVVQHWIDEAEVGNYDIDWVEGCLAEMATYVLAGELALGEVLAGDLPRPEFPDALRQVAPDAGGPARPSRSISLIRPRGTTTLSRARGLLAKAAIEVAEAAFAERGEWVLTEEGHRARGRTRRAC